ncbi:hypothetical protein WA158_006812 [Blastocystis sp. Blastoise]
MKVAAPLTAKGIELINFERSHCELYSEWLKDDYILEMTDTDGMTLEDIILSQESYAEEEDKITVLLSVNKEGSANEKVLIGDCNLFIDYVDEEGDVGELNVMVAEKDYRRKGYAIKAVALMIMWAHKNCNLNEFMAKIKLSNEASYNMFKKLGFTTKTVSKAFKEYELRFTYTNESAKTLVSTVGIPFKI